MRKMTNSFEGVQFYESTFDTETGTLVRIVDNSDNEEYVSLENFILDKKFRGSESRQMKRKMQDEFSDRFREKYSWDRSEAFSPVPETLDVGITRFCAHGCPGCYQDSTTEGKHASADHVTKILKGFDVPPYQVAIGGGEPCTHPDLPSILRGVREIGTVPNYTTAGYVFRQDVIEATNEVCGGISLNYHPHKGIEWFKETYSKWRAVIKRPLNVHLVADKNVADDLMQLILAEGEIGKLSIILLAYYPNVGRATLSGIMPKRIYNVELPRQIQEAMSRGHKIAFSEGLLPYFISRPEIGVNTKFATRSEGIFTAYVDEKGWMHSSSFDTFEHDPAEIISPMQQQWNKLRVRRDPHGSECYNCREKSRCATPNMHHYLACAFAGHNGKRPPLTKRAQREQDRNDLFSKMEEKEKELGRNLTQEEMQDFWKVFNEKEDD